MSAHNTYSELQKTILSLRKKRAKAVKQIEQIDKLLIQLEVLKEK